MKKVKKIVKKNTAKGKAKVAEVAEPEKKEEAKEAPEAKPSQNEKPKPAKAKEVVKERVAQAPEAKPMTEEKAKLAKEAVDEILKGISEPGAQTYATFVPENWSQKYKKDLGGYRKFCESQTDKLRLVTRSNGSWVLCKASDTTAPPEFQRRKRAAVEWKRLAAAAWAAYCKITPEAERSKDVFLSAVEDGPPAKKPKQAAAAKAPAAKAPAAKAPVAKAAAAKAAA